MNQTVILLCILLFSLGLVPFVLRLFRIQYEGYSNYLLPGDVPRSQTEVLVQDTYPRIPFNEAKETNSSETIWKNEPIFTLGSYEQITNNIRYPKNPDDGTCMPASMCGVLYHDAYLGKNEITPLPPANDNGIRIGYFTTAQDTPLVDSLPYTTNTPNILY